MWERFTLLLRRVSVADLRSEDGQTTVEYTMIVLVAALLAAGLFALLSPDLLQSVVDKISTAITGI